MKERKCKNRKGSVDKFWNRGEREKEKKCKNRKGSVDKFWNRKERKCKNRKEAVEKFWNRKERKFQNRKDQQASSLQERDICGLQNREENIYRNKNDNIR